MNFHIVTDGSCDLPQGVVRQTGITVVPFYVSFDSKTYYKEIEEIGIRDFYDRMVANPGVYPKSSMPTAQDYANVFEPLAAAGTPVVCICITTKFSGSMQSAELGKKMVLEQYPEARITVIDAMVNTVLQGLHVREAVRLQQAQTPYEKAVERLLEMRASGRIFFTIGSMDYLQHGGRIGKLAGKVATVLNVRPLITLKSGEIFPAGIARSRRASMDKVIALLQAYLKETGKPVSQYTVCVGYGYSVEEGEQFRREVMQAVGISADAELPKYQIGATIAVHTGPYPIGVAIIEKAF